MQRREFLTKAAAVISSASVSVNTSATSEKSAPSSDIRIRELFITNDRDRVVALAQAIVAGRYRFLSAVRAEENVRFADPNDLDIGYNSAYLLWADDGEQPWLLDFNFSEAPIPGAKKDGFIPWLTAFNPRNCNDWLMVPDLYSRHIYDTESINWGNPPAFSQPPNLDSVLSVSRGLLLWQWQAERLVAQYCDVSRREAATLWREYYCSHDKYPIQRKRMNESTYEGHSFSDLIMERTLTGLVCVGIPDYLLSGFLSEHLSIL
jgi:hypothetical protein